MVRLVNATTILEKLTIGNLFDAIIDGNKVSKAKPDPEIFLKGAMEVNIPPSNCIVFEDAEAGIDAALAAGMKCIGVGNSLTLYKADWIVSGFEGLTYKKFKEFEL